MLEKGRAEGEPACTGTGCGRDRDPGDGLRGMKADHRLKAAAAGETVIEDQFQGRVVWEERETSTNIVNAAGDVGHSRTATCLRWWSTDTYMGIVTDRATSPHINAARKKQITTRQWDIPSRSHIT